MSLGQTASAPASTWLTAVRASSSSVSSFATVSPSSTPQCPWSVYSQRQTSVSSVSPGASARSARSARWTIPSSSQAPEPSSSFASGMPKSSTARTPEPGELARLADELVDRALRDPGQPVDRTDDALARAREERHHDVVERRATSRARARAARRCGAAAAGAWPGSSRPKRTHRESLERCDVRSRSGRLTRVSAARSRPRRRSGPRARPPTTRGRPARRRTPRSHGPPPSSAARRARRGCRTARRPRAARR